MPFTFIPVLAVFIAGAVAAVRKTRPVRFARMVLWVAMAPAAALEIFAACFFALGLIKETREYFGADMAFGLGTIISAIWIVIIGIGYAIGRMLSENKGI